MLVVGHVLHRHDHRDHTLVAVSAGHLVAGLDATLHGEVDLDDLEHARRQIVTALKLLALDLVTLFKLGVLLFKQSLGRRQLTVEIRIRELELEPLLTVQIPQHGLGQLGTFAEAAARYGRLAFQQAGEARKRRLFVDAVFLFEVLAIVRQLRCFDLLGARVLLKTIAGEDLYIDHGALVA